MSRPYVQCLMWCMNAILLTSSLFASLPFAPQETQESRRPTVVLHTMGQLGNRMFQVAAASALAWDNQAEPFFPMIAPSSEEGRHVFFRCNLAACPTPSLTTWHEPRFSFTPIPYHPHIKLHGYFQSEKYFLHHRERLLQLFEPLPNDSEYIRRKYGRALDNPTTVGIQLRSYKREDPASKIYPQFGKHYLERAMSLFPENTLFIVSSNDQNYAQSCIPSRTKNILFLQGEPPYIDLFVLSMCHHIIISNSSFGWWAAWLNKNPMKRVVRPHPIFYGLPTQDYYPASWIAIEALPE